VKVALADVKSPEDRLGAGTRHRKWSASARLERALPGGGLYALGEAEGTLVYRTLLAEVQWTRGRTAKDPPSPALPVLEVTGIDP